MEWQQPLPPLGMLLLIKLVTVGMPELCRVDPFWFSQRPLRPGARILIHLPSK